MLLPDWMSGSTERIRARLYEIAAMAEGDLAEGSLLIALEEYPHLEIARYLAFIDEAADAAARRLGANGDDVEAARRALGDELFGERRFSGAAVDYYDPRNSYLNDVIDRRRGIPITLAIVYLAVGHRLGQPVAGINSPGHFLVRHGETVLDAFDAGRVVPRAEFVKQLGDRQAPDPETAAMRLFAEPPTSREVLTRVLGNLKVNHLRTRDLPRALSVLDRLVEMNPDQPHWLRERGALYQHLDCPHAAIADLERYCELAPTDPENDVARSALMNLLRNAPPLH
jgi:regulator of sirC expression with transglutaminase-like and TPR domain